MLRFPAISSRVIMSVCLLVYCAGVVGFVGYQNLRAKQELFRHLDRNLFLTANSLKHMLAPDLHDRATDRKSISYEEDSVFYLS